MQALATAPGSQGECTSASVGNTLLGAPVALMVIVFPENTHNTAKSGLLKKFKVSNTRAFSLLPDNTAFCLWKASNVF